MQIVEIVAILQGPGRACTMIARYADGRIEVAENLVSELQVVAAAGRFTEGHEPADCTLERSLEILDEWRLRNGKSRSE